jgi:hypothetical protein
VNALGTARDLAQLRDHLEWAAHQGSGYGDWQHAPAAASYRHLLDRLTQIDPPDGEVTAAVAEAVSIYAQAERRARAAQEAREAQRDAERAEAARRHQIALMIGCVTCDAGAGADCHTIGPGQRPKGIEVHRGRYDMAAR